MQGVLFAAGRELMEKGSGDRTVAFERAWLHSRDRDFYLSEETSGILEPVLPV